MNGALISAHSCFRARKNAHTATEERSKLEDAKGRNYNEQMIVSRWPREKEFDRTATRVTNYCKYEYAERITYRIRQNERM